MFRLRRYLEETVTGPGLRPLWVRGLAEFRRHPRRPRPIVRPRMSAASPTGQGPGRRARRALRRRKSWFPCLHDTSGALPTDSALLFRLPCPTIRRCVHGGGGAWPGRNRSRCGSRPSTGPGGFRNCLRSRRVVSRFSVAVESSSLRALVTRCREGFRSDELISMSSRYARPRAKGRSLRRAGSRRSAQRRNRRYGCRQRGDRRVHVLLGQVGAESEPHRGLGDLGGNPQGGENV